MRDFLRAYGNAAMIGPWLIFLWYAEFNENAVMVALVSNIVQLAVLNVVASVAVGRGRKE